MSAEQIWQMIVAQRRELAVFLDTLSDEEWNTPSLCAGWLVRDVVAHIVLMSRYTRKNSMMSLARHGFRLNKFMFEIARDISQRPPAELITMLREDETKQSTPILTRPVGLLVDLLVHDQDIRIAINKERSYSEDTLKVVFHAFGSGGYGIGEILVGVRKNTRGLQLVAPDVDWKHGSSTLVVEGNAQDILMAIVGRLATLDRLSGDGVETLKRRIE